MPVGAIVATVGGSVASAVIGASAAKKAAKAQTKASDKASDVTLQMYEQTRSDLAPYAGTGGSALTSIAEQVAARISVQARTVSNVIPIEMID